MAPVRRVSTASVTTTRVARQHPRGVAAPEVGPRRDVSKGSLVGAFVFAAPDAAEERWLRRRDTATILAPRVGGAVAR